MFWTGALCINQEQSTPERNHQVAQMGVIYENAFRIITWIGLGRDTLRVYAMIRSTHGPTISWLTHRLSTEPPQNPTGTGRGCTGVHPGAKELRACGRCSETRRTHFTYCSKWYLPLGRCSTSRCSLVNCKTWDASLRCCTCLSLSLRFNATKQWTRVFVAQSRQRR